MWHGFTQTDYEQLESVDHMWIKNLLECSNKVPSELLFLELGVCPIRHIINKKQKLNLTLFRFFLAQMKNPRQGDWVHQALADLSQLEIHENIDQIRKMLILKYNLILHDKIKN